MPVDTALLVTACSLASAIAIAIWGTLRPKAFAAIAADETGNFATEAFLGEPDLWRVQVRSLHALAYVTASLQNACNWAETAIEWSLGAFLAGLGFSLILVVMLLVEST